MSSHLTNSEQWEEWKKHQAKSEETAPEADEEAAHFHHKENAQEKVADEEEEAVQVPAAVAAVAPVLKNRAQRHQQEVEKPTLHQHNPELGWKNPF